MDAATCNAFAVTTSPIKQRGFALRMTGASMAPTIPGDAVMIVDPGATPVHGSVVVVQRKMDSEPICRRMMIEGGRPSLVPDNTQYAVEPLGDDAIICGVVCQIVITL